LLIYWREVLVTAELALPVVLMVGASAVPSASRCSRKAGLQSAAVPTGAARHESDPTMELRER
jgi:hypothetical protein